jgi:hypothetical protein
LIYIYLKLNFNRKKIRHTFKTKKIDIHFNPKINIEKNWHYKTIDTNSMHRKNIHFIITYQFPFYFMSVINFIMKIIGNIMY